MDKEIFNNEIVDDASAGAIAIIGMALRVPGASTLERFWNNLRTGTESAKFFTDDELRAAGIPEASLRHPDYVKAFGALEGIDLFDAALFDIPPREAETLDPQHRQLLECGWEALEHAGYGSGSLSIERAGRVGVMAGVGLNSYLLHNLMGRTDLIDTIGSWQISLGNDKDFAATRLAYKLNLRGAALNVSTACSTSLVATAMGCQSLLSYQCDMVLAGGCSVQVQQDQGYWHHPGGTLSPDGRCRAFDAQAQGTFDGNGVAMVVLKRLDDALRDGDTVHAIIRGFAVNNDGAQKVGYTAPSVQGQMSVIREAQEMAEADASTIGYVETHGTGTDLGDMVEVNALTEAFRQAGVETIQQCAIGSVKTNIGHLDTAAGTASLIKTVLGLQHGQIPPSLHFTQANPKLELESSPFYVNASLCDWPRLNGAPRRAGVSSFGIGGTNVHLIVEEAQPAPSASTSRAWHLLPLSAHSDTALKQNAKRLAAHLRQHPDVPLADVAYTLQCGRRFFAQRRVVLAQNSMQAIAMLESIEKEIKADAEYAELNAIAQSWLTGGHVDWPTLYINEQRKRVPLPAYAFDHRRYWVNALPEKPAKSVLKEENTGKLADPDRWFYLPVWCALPPLARHTGEIKGRWLLIGALSGIAPSIAQRLRAAGADVDVDVDVNRNEKPFDHVVYCGLQDVTANDDEALLEAGFYAVLGLGRSLGRKMFSGSTTLTVVTSGVFPAEGACVMPAKAAVLGPLRVLPQEYPHVRCRIIDIAVPELAWQRERMLDGLLAELVGGERAVALRHSTRWVEYFEPYRWTASVKPVFRDGGVYLITGGLGNIGLTIAAHIARKAPGAHLILTSRQPLEKQPPARIEQVRALEASGASGATVHVEVADVTDEQKMESLIEDIERQHGALHGIVHAAGIVGQASFATVSESSPGFCATQFNPKLKGARVLENILGDRPLDFCMLCSSLSPILGGLGFAAYAAANACLDAFVIEHNRRHPVRWIGVNWEGWSFDTELQAKLQANQAGASVAELGLLPDEGAQAFERILAAPPTSRIVLSTGNLEQRIKQWVEMDMAHPETPSAARHPRPAMLGLYVAPEGPLQIEVGRLWERLLGIDGIGAEDNFFELGGNSLLLTQLSAQIRKAFRLELSLTLLFERPTIAGIASLIEAALAEVVADVADEVEREEGVL